MRTFFHVPSFLSSVTAVGVTCSPFPDHRMPVLTGTVWPQPGLASYKGAGKCPSSSSRREAANAAWLAEPAVSSLLGATPATPGLLSIPVRSEHDSIRG